MTSRVRVDMSLCDFKTIIDADSQPDGTVKVKIRSECRDVREYGKALKSAGPEDYTSIKGSRIFDLAAESRLTPTCLVPTAVFNAIWLEVGMISKTLARKEKSICIHFEE